MKRFRFLASLAFVFSLFLTIPSVSAQANVSCNDSYYVKQNYVDIKLPEAGPAGTKPIVNWWAKSSGWGLRAIVYQNGTRIDTVDIPSGASNNLNKKWDSREVNYGDTIRYEIRILSDLNIVASWMPANVGQYSGYCGTGCPNTNGGNYAVGDLNSLFTSATAGGIEAYNLTDTPYTLFLPGQRTQDSVDTAMTCWNDSDGDGGKDTDYNDFFMMWTLSSTTVAAAPEVTTNDPSAVLVGSATLNGKIDSDGGATITERGFVLSKSSTTPTIETGDKLTISQAVTDLAKNVAGLDANTKYYYQAYAINSIGTTYGGVKSFTTTAATDELAVTTDNASNIQQTSATLNGTLVSFKSGTTITERGFVYSSSDSTPDLNSGTQVSANGTDVGAFSTSISGLSPFTQYYYVAYAKDSEDTVEYGEVKVFTTLENEVPHTPEETGIAEDMMIVAGAVLYVVGIMSFMGSKAVAAKQKQQTNPLAEK